MDLLKSERTSKTVTITSPSASIISPRLKIYESARKHVDWQLSEMIAAYMHL